MSPPSSGAAEVAEVDPFDLPDWLGTEEVTWSSGRPVQGCHLATGVLSAGERSLACDLLAVDQAFPAPVVSEAWRSRSHREWTHGQVLLLRLGGRLTCAVPGTRFGADDVLDVVGRLARAVGADPQRFVVALRPRG